MKRIISLLLCCVLICCAVLRPVPVHASAGGVVAAVAGTTVGLPAALVVGTALVGLGLFAKETGAFDDLVTSISNSLPSTLSYLDEAGNRFVTMVQVGGHLFVNTGFLSYVQSQIFSSGSVSSTRRYMGTELFSTDKFASYGYRYLLSSVSDSNEFRVVFSPTAAYVGTDYGYPAYTFKASGLSSPAVYQCGPHYSAATYSSSSIWAFKTSEWSLSSVTLDSVFSPIAGFGIGNLAEDLEDEKYKTWVDSPIISIDWGIQLEPDPTDPTEPSQPKQNPIPWVPFKVPGMNPDFTQNIQQDIQQGGKPGDGVKLDTSQSVKVELDQSSVPDNLKPGAGGSVDPGSMKRDFTQVFPFCIPFDLYRLLHALVADPVAPEFDVSFPYPGGVYEDTIDLSAWNEVAAMVRKFEVAIFCVGLVLLTGKVIRW